MKKTMILSTLVVSQFNYAAEIGGVQDFLDALRDFESGINPALSNFYLENLDNPVYNYAQVTVPGRLVRDCNTGSMISEPTTIRGFFNKLGLSDIYNPNTPHDPEMFRRMQYNSVNAWGFIGYQLGEAVLIDAGYYSPTTKEIDGREYDSFYMFVPDSTWIGCKTEALAEIPGSGGNKVYVTDINRWEGTFIGKNGIDSLVDLKIPAKQEMVIRDAMHFNYGIISKLLTDNNMTWEQALQKTWPDRDDNGNPITVQSTMSGILAAAHLRGAWGVADLLIKDSITCDEIGTCITKYVHKFGGYDTLFDVPGDSTTHGSIYDEVLTAGWGQDTVITGGGSDTIHVNEYSGGSVVVNDFTLGDDRLVLSAWTAEDPLASLVINSSPEGDAELSFAGQSVTLKGITASDIAEFGVNKVIFKSSVYPMAWTGIHEVSDFDPSIDKIKGTAGIGFNHLKAYETENELVIGPQAQDGGIYSFYKLKGLSLNDLHAGMFVDVTGSFNRLGFIVPLNWQTWGWNAILTVNSFDVSKTVLTSSEAVPFDSVKLSQVDNDTVITLLEPFAQGNKKKLILKGIVTTDLTEKNFSGFTGNFSDITVE
ncbi:sugar-binding protein [Vibrio mediterranei]|uniref:sugar-binding protein n=1 Tax=Vibrio mediterranei TaxID=689 RepID=UPI001EFD12E7|nr:sugar-binding protein [Vibrio mediterranei]MCG9627755.1 sugar-binding protein [Vibrio mediterranei]